MAAVAGDTAMSGGSGSDGGGGCGAPVGVGTYAYEGHIVHVVCTAAVAAYATHTGIERTHGEIAVVGTAPAPVDMKLATGVVAVENEAVACRHIAARIKDGALLVELGTQQCAESSIAIVVAGNGSHVGTVFEYFIKAVCDEGAIVPPVL